MRLLRLALAPCAAALLLAPPSAAATPSLVATVGPGFTITLTKSGTKVRSLKAGTYRITVRDRSAAHNFRLKGPGVNKATSVAGTGTSTWKVRLRPGTYVIVCDPHVSSMKGSFRAR
jgi:plastocyanin